MVLNQILPLWCKIRVETPESGFQPLKPGGNVPQPLKLFLHPDQPTFDGRKR
jgi:hypothetical protein